MCWGAHRYWTCGLLNYGVVLSAGASALTCTTVVSASLREYTEHALGLAAAGKNSGKEPQWISFTHLGQYLPERHVNLLGHPGPMVLPCWSSCSLVILVHCSSWFLDNPSHLRSSSHSSCALAWVATCNYLRAALKPILSSVWEPTSLLGWEETEQTDRGTGGTNDDPHLSSPKGLPWEMGWPLSYLLLSLVAEQLDWKSRGVTGAVAAGQVGIGQLKVPAERMVTSR